MEQETRLTKKLEEIANGKTISLAYTYCQLEDAFDGEKGITKKAVVQKEKDQKPLRCLRFEENRWSEDAMLPAGLALTCLKGKKENMPNQDNVCIIVVDDKFAFYAVFDGHGPKGHFVADLARGYLVQDFVDRVLADGMTDTEKALNACFQDTQKFIKVTDQEPPKGETSLAGAEVAKMAESSGTTCTVCYQNLQTANLTIAYVGDSRAMLFNDDDPKFPNPLVVTQDHKPEVEKEKKRIEAAGGRVVFDGYYNHRVFAKAGMYPGLNMSRAIGDIKAHEEAGLTAEPEVLNQDLTGGPDGKVQAKYLLLCSDGVWEFIENDSAPAMVMAKIAEHTALRDPDPVKEALKHLGFEAYQKWMEDSDHEISDDISGILVKLF